MKWLLRFTDIVANVIIVAFVVLVLFVATASSLLRHYLPDVNDYRKPLLEQINARNSKLVIDAREIRSEWKLFQPEISLHGVSIRAADLEEGVQLKKLAIKLNFIKSVIRQELYFDSIELASLQLTLIEDADGQWSLAGLQGGNNETPGLAKVLDHLWAVDALEVRNARLSVQPYGRQKIELPGIQARLSTYRYKKYFSINLLDGQRPLGSVMIHTRHRPVDSQFSARAYLKLDDYALAGLGALLPEQTVINSGNLSGEFWWTLKNGESNFSGKLGLADSAIDRQGRHWRFAETAATFYGSYRQQQLELSITDALLAVDDQRRVALSKIRLTHADSFRLQLAALPLPELYQLSQALPLPEALSKALDTLSPAGSLQAVDMRFGGSEAFSLKARLHEVSVDAWAGAPELRSVTGYLEAGREGGFVEFDGPDFSMHFPNIYKQAMQFDHASGYVDWRLDPQGLYVSGKKPKLDAASGQAMGEFAFISPRVKTAADSMRLSLMVGLKNSEARFRNIFIPELVSDGLRNWLDLHIHQGLLPEVGFVFHGPTQKDAIDEKVVQLWLDINDASISYADKWPKIEHINGEFLLDDRFGFARVDHATSQEVAINSADFRLFPVAGEQAIEVTGKLEASALQALRFLQNDALADIMNHALDDWQVSSGKVSSGIHVGLSLAKGETRPQVKVSASLDGVSLKLPQQNIQIDTISGPLLFDSATGLSSEQLVGSFWGRPLQAGIVTRTEKGEANSVIRLRSEVAIADLARWSGQPMVNLLSGSAPLDAEMYYGPAGSGLRLASDLQGIEVNLPKPFYKAANDRRDLQVHLPFADGQRELDVHYGEGINAHFRITDQGIDAGTINLGLSRAEYQKGKIVLGGQMVNVDLHAWLEVMDRYEKITQAATPAGAAAGQPALVFLVEKLKIKTLTGYGQSLDSVSVDLFNTVSYWQVGVDHRDLKATLNIYADGAPMDLHLHRVNLEFLSEKQQESGVSYASSSWSRFPDMNVVIDKLLSGGEDYGEWEFKVRSYDKHMALEDMQASFKAMRLTTATDEGASLYWTLGDHPETFFKGLFVSDNIANTLKAWGYKQEVHSKSAEFLVSSSWQGGPTDFAFNSMLATIKFRLESGNFADVSSSGTDALKFIGVFNIANLVKRLQLDFSDLTSEGLAYDRVTGIVSADHGVYHFQQPVLVKSPTSKIRFYGGFDMNTDTLDMTMGVTLPLASNLPWIVALAAGLPTAAGVYIVSKVLDKQVDKLSSAVYRVSGPFAEPEIKFDSLFDTEDGYEKQRKARESGTGPASTDG